jgi:23S rRNA pseudouridine1911/1915/1917 synthase
LNLSIEPNPRLALTLAHEDGDLLVVHKPARMVTTPGKGHEHDSLMNALFASHGPRLQNIGRERDFGLLHRLDRETSGLLIVALTKSAYDHLRGQFESRTIRKFYWAIVWGIPDPAKGVIDRPIKESQERTGKYTARKVAAVSRAAGRHGSSGPPKPAVTAFRVVSEPVVEPGRKPRPPACVVECRPVTGRLHQVRVHMAMIGHPVLGDDEYADGPAASACPRLALHAHRLVFQHPVSGAGVDVRTEFPADLRGCLRKFGLAAPRD